MKIISSSFTTAIASLLLMPSAFCAIDKKSSPQTQTPKPPTESPVKFIELPHIILPGPQMPMFVAFTPTEETCKAEAERRTLNAFAILRLNLDHKDAYSAIKNFDRTFGHLKSEDLITILRLAVANQVTNFLISILYSYQKIPLSIKSINSTLFFITLKKTNHNDHIEEPLYLITRNQVDLYFSKNFIPLERKKEFYEQIPQANDQERAMLWQKSGIGFIEHPR